MALVASTSVTTDAQPDDQSTDKDASVPQARSQEKDVHEAGNSEVEAAKDSLASPYCCGVWSLGDPFDDQAKVGAALDKLGPFVLESYACPLPLIKSGRDPFDADVDDDRSSTRVCELEELQLNDVVESIDAVDSISNDESIEGDSIEEVSDGVFESRQEAIDRHTSKRKRKEFKLQDRSNYIKHNLRRRVRGCGRKRKKLIKPRNGAVCNPHGQKSVC